MTDLPILIAGGGIGGLTAALCLAARGFEVEVLEQAPEFGEVGAGIQISPNPARVLHALGLEEVLAAVAFLPEGGQTRDWRSGDLILEVPLGPLVRERYGFPYYHIHRADLIAALSEAAAEHPNIELATNMSVTGFELDGEKVVVEAGAGIREGRLLVGADGIHSAVRTSLFGPEAPTFTGCIAWRSLVPVDRLPEGLVRPVASNWWGPGKHFVHYYVRRGEMVNCVCVVEKEGWELESWTERGDHAELKADFAGWHQDIQCLIDNMDPGTCYKWALYDRPPMPRWTDGAAALLGDACHPTLPFMAQGAAMAIEDGAVLAGCVAADGSLPANLKRYEQLRQERTARIQQGSRRNARIFHMNGAETAERNRTATQSRGQTNEWLFSYDAFAAAKI